MSDYDELVTGLRAWTKDHDPHVRAAVDLLIWKESWLRRGSFVRACVSWDSDGLAWINWDKARKFADSKAAFPASTSELAILDLAVAIGENRYKLSIMGDAHAKAIVRAFACALGEEPAT